MLSRSRGAKLPLCISMHLAAFKECHPTPWSSSLSSAPRSCPRFPHAPKSQERRAASRQFLPLLDSHIHHRATEAAIPVVRTAASYIFTSRPNSCTLLHLAIRSCGFLSKLSYRQASRSCSKGNVWARSPSSPADPAAQTRTLEATHLGLQLFSLAPPSRCPRPWSPYPSQ